MTISTLTIFESHGKQFESLEAAEAYEEKRYILGLGRNQKRLKEALRTAYSIARIRNSYASCQPDAIAALKACSTLQSAIAQGSNKITKLMNH